jgi:hypothetical protein
MVLTDANRSPGPVPKCGRGFALRSHAMHRPGHNATLAQSYYSLRTRRGSASLQLALPPLQLPPRANSAPNDGIFLAWQVAGFLLLVLIGFWDRYEQEATALRFSGPVEHYCVARSVRRRFRAAARRHSPRTPPQSRIDAPRPLSPARAAKLTIGQTARRRWHPRPQCRTASSRRYRLLRSLRD